VGALREKQADLKNEYDDMTRAELVKKRKREMTKTIKYWLGAVGENQMQSIDTWARELPDGRSQWLNNRERWIDAFAEALKNRDEPKLLSEKIDLLFVTPEQMWTAEFRALTERNRHSALRLIADLHNSRTQKQRDAERKRVAQWLGNLDQLARD
jgi:hypothetical protein